MAPVVPLIRYPVVPELSNVFVACKVASNARALVFRFVPAFAVTVPLTGELLPES